MCTCDICKIGFFVKKYFSEKNQNTDATNASLYSHELITTDIGMLCYNACDNNFGVVTDESLNIIKNNIISCKESLKPIHGESLSQLTKEQVIIVSEFENMVFELAGGAEEFVSKALELTSIGERLKFISNSDNFNMRKYSEDALSRLAEQLGEI